MVPVTPTFPLLKLPLLARENVIRRMICLDRMSFSLCSKRTKRFLKSLRVTVQEIHISISNVIIFEVPKMDEEEYKFTFDNPAECWRSNFTVTGSMLNLYGNSLVGEREERSWNVPNFSVIEWIAHILEIIDSPSLSLEFCENCDSFSIRDIHQLFGTRERADLSIRKQSTPDEYLLEVLETFRPSKYLSLFKNPFSNRLAFRKYLRQKMDEITLRNNATVTINEIFSMDCITADIGESKISTSALNTMLKVWTEGWTPRMKLISMYYTLRYLGENYMEEILDGLEFRKVEQERILKHPVYDDEQKTSKKSYDIVRKDGQRATVFPRIFDNGKDMQMEFYFFDQ